MKGVLFQWPARACPLCGGVRGRGGESSLGLSHLHFLQGQCEDLAKILAQDQAACRNGYSQKCGELESGARKGNRKKGKCTGKMKTSTWGCNQAKREML